MRTEAQTIEAITKQINLAINKPPNIKFLSGLLNEYTQGIHTSQSLNDLDERYREAIKDGDNFNLNDVWFGNDFVLQELDLGDLTLEEWEEETYTDPRNDCHLYIVFDFKNEFEYTPGGNPQYPELNNIRIIVLPDNGDFDQRFSNASDLRYALDNSSLNLT